MTGFFFVVVFFEFQNILLDLKIFRSNFCLLWLWNMDIRNEIEILKNTLILILKTKIFKLCLKNAKEKLN